MLLGDYPNTLPLKNGQIKSSKVNLEFDCKADRGLFCWLDTDQGARVVA